MLLLRASEGTFTYWTGLICLSDWAASSFTDCLSIALVAGLFSSSMEICEGRRSTISEVFLLDCTGVFSIEFCGETSSFFSLTTSI